MTVERFIYYRVVATPQLRAALLAMQHSLQAQHPQLHARLLCRVDAGSGDATWMEMYASPEGVEAALLDEIETLAAQTLGTNLVGTRHIESFEPCAS